MRRVKNNKVISPLEFFSHLKWLDGKPLLDVIEPYRQHIFMEALYTFDEQNPKYNLGLSSRAKKNWKSADLVLAGLYRLLAWQSPLGNQCYILANDQGQAGDDLELCKKLIKANPVLEAEVIIKKDIIERKDGVGFLEILPAQDTAGAHGKTFLFCGFDEIHEYRTWDILEAMQLDPHRPDALLWIASYQTLYNRPGVPLFDLIQQAKQGEDHHMFFSMYSGDYCTDPEFIKKETPEERANPSVLPKGYLEQQKRRLPFHRYRRLHLNIGGSPEGAYFTSDKVEAAISSHKILPFNAGHHYRAFVDMSGGSGDDATISIAHTEDDRIIIDGVWNQGRRPPFDPRRAVELFVSILKGYGISSVTGDRYAGETFRQDFQRFDIGYDVAPLPKSQLYECLEVELNSGRVALPDNVQLIQQLLTLVIKGGKIDHLAGEHDDLANAVAGSTWLCRERLVPINFKEDVVLGPSMDEVMELWEDRRGIWSTGGGSRPWDK